MGGKREKKKNPIFLHLRLDCVASQKVTSSRQAKSTSSLSGKARSRPSRRPLREFPAGVTFATQAPSFGSSLGDYLVSNAST